MVVLAALSALTLPTIVPAAVSSGGFEHKAKLKGGGDRAVAIVPLACDEPQPAKLTVTITQGSANGQDRAFGRGSEKLDCPVEPSGVRISVGVKQGEFAAGKATACGLAVRTMTRVSGAMT